MHPMRVAVGVVGIAPPRARAWARLAKCSLVLLLPCMTSHAQPTTTHSLFNAKGCLPCGCASVRPAWGRGPGGPVCSEHWIPSPALLPPPPPPLLRPSEGPRIPARGPGRGADRARWMGGRERAPRSSPLDDFIQVRPSLWVTLCPPSGEAVNPHRGVREAGVASSAKNLPSVGGGAGPLGVGLPLESE
jgi:hypothetical protein